MTPFLFSELFIAALLLTTATKLWLAKRHLAYIKSHRAEVPSPFNEKIDLAAHQKAADYTSSKTHLAMLEALFEAVVLWGFTLGGGIQKIASIPAAILHIADRPGHGHHRDGADHFRIAGSPVQPVPHLWH